MFIKPSHIHKSKHRYRHPMSDLINRITYSKKGTHTHTHAHTYTHRYRHLMNDLINLIPHCKKDNKLDTKNDRNVINEVADMKSCNSVIYFEVCVLVCVCVVEWSGVECSVVCTWKSYACMCHNFCMCVHACVYERGGRRFMRLRT